MLRIFHTADARTRARARKALAWLAFAAAAGLLVLGLGSAPTLAQDGGQDKADRKLSVDGILAAAPASDWRTIDPENTLYLDLDGGRVIIELNPAFAPRHVEAIRAMVRAGVKDPLINRVQDNFVVQWNITSAPQPTLKGEFTRPDAPELGFTPHPDGDVYAPEVGFTGGMPAARDRQGGTAWLVHCYGMVGVGRENPADSGTGAELYAVIGHAPRHLDRNVTMIGRIVAGMELLSGLPRGNGAMGFYEPPLQPIRFKAVRLAADVPETEREVIEVLRTESATFAAVVDARRNRQDEFYHVPAGAIDLCSVQVPVRRRAPGAQPR